MTIEVLYSIPNTSYFAFIGEHLVEFGMILKE